MRITENQYRSTKWLYMKNIKNHVDVPVSLIENWVSDQHVRSFEFEAVKTEEQMQEMKKQGKTPQKRKVYCLDDALRVCEALALGFVLLRFNRITCKKLQRDDQKTSGWLDVENIRNHHVNLSVSMIKYLAKENYIGSFAYKGPNGNGVIKPTDYCLDHLLGWCEDMSLGLTLLKRGSGVKNRQGFYKVA